MNFFLSFLEGLVSGSVWELTSIWDSGWEVGRWTGLYLLDAGVLVVDELVGVGWVLDVFLSFLCFFLSFF